MKENLTCSLTSRYIETRKYVFSFLRIQLGSPPSYDFSRKSFTPNFSKSCLFPKYADYHYIDGIVFKNGKWEPQYLLVACLERIFIFIGTVAIVLGSIISIWANLDSEFQNLHKLALNENDNKISTVPSKHVETKNKECQTLQTTNATNVSNNISNRHEGSIKSKLEI